MRSTPCKDEVGGAHFVWWLQFFVLHWFTLQWFTWQCWRVLCVHIAT